MCGQMFHLFPGIHISVITEQDADVLVSRKNNDVEVVI